MNTPLLPREKLASARALFPHTTQGKIYLNHAGTSPLSTRVVDAMTRYLHERSIGRLDNYQVDVGMVAECRSFVQKLIKAESPDRIAFQVNTSDAINIVASGIPWKSGDRVLLNDIEFPANVYPYLNLKNLGVEIDIIHSDNGRVTPEMIVGALTPRTRLLAVSAVQFLSGYRADLSAIGELCRRRGTIFAVDGIQAVGAVRLDVQQMKIDALAAGGQKWQMSPHGTGFLYLTEDLQSLIQQKYLGWLAVEDPWNFHNYNQALASPARRYEGGSLNMPSLWGMHASLATLLEFGIDAIESHILALTQILVDGFQQIDTIELYTPGSPHERAGIVTITLPAKVDQKAVFKMMLERNITAALRESKMRFSPHFYNSPEEMTTGVEVMREYLTRTSA